MSKVLRHLLRLVVPSLSLINLPDIIVEFPDINFPDEVKQQLSLSKQYLRGITIYTLALHSDIVHRHTICSFTTLRLTEHEASGTKSLLNPHDLALMKTVVLKEGKDGAGWGPT